MGTDVSCRIRRRQRDGFACTTPAWTRTEMLTREDTATSGFQDDASRRREFKTTYGDLGEKTTRASSCGAM
jgi:hypothetical protein